MGHMFQDHAKWVERGAEYEMSVFYGYGKGGPARRRRKDDPDDNNLPPSFDLDKLDLYRKLRLPGGLLVAMERAAKNSAHPLKGTTWLMHIWRITPGVWLHLDTEGEPEWALVFSTELSRMIVVNRSGEYYQVKKADAPGIVLEVKDEPPWLEDWLREVGMLPPEEPAAPVKKPAKRGR